MATDLLLQPGEDPKDLDIISTIKEWEEGPENVFQIESPHAPRLYNVDFDSFDKYMTRPWDLESQDIYDMRARGQSVGEKFRYGVTKLVGKTTTAVAGGVGMIVHGLPNMIYNLGAEAIDPEGTEGGYGDAFRSIFENDFQRGLDGINEWMDEKLPHYYSKEEQEMNIWKSMVTPNFWMNDFVNGLSFVAGAVLTELATAGLITAAMPLRATQFLNGISRANQIKRATEATGVVSKFSKAGTMQNIVNATTIGRRLVTGAGYEAGVEARHHYDQTMDALMESWKESPEGQARIQELGPRAQPTQEEMGKMHNLATQSTNGVFVGNLALVGAGNLIAFPRIFGAGYNMNRQSIGRVIKNASDDVAQRYSAAYKSFTKGEKIASGAYTLLKVPLYEGWVEEGGQAWMDIGGRKSSLDFYTANKNPNSMEAIGGMMEGMYDTFAETYGDKHVHKEIALGMILGAMGLPSFVRTNEKTGKKELKFEHFHMSGGSFGQFQDRAEKREGADALAKWMNENPSAVKAMKNNFDALTRSANASDKMDYALMTNNIYDWKNAKHDHFFSYVYSRAKAGFFEDVLEDINDIKVMDINSFGKMFYPGETELSEDALQKRRDKVVESATKAANNVKDSYELVKQNGSRFSNDIQLMLAHSSSVAKDLDKRTENIRNLLGEFGVDLSALEAGEELENVIKEAYKTTAESLGKTTQIEALVRDYAEEGSDILTSYSKAFEKLGLEKPDESKLHEGEKVAEAEFSEATLRTQIIRTATEINKLQKELKTLQEKNEGDNFSQENLDKINDLTARLNNLNTTYLRVKNTLQEGVESTLTPQDIQVLNAFEKENPMVFAERRDEIIQALIDLRKLRARRHGFIGLYNQLFTPDGQQEALQQVEDIIVSRDKLATEAGIEDEKLKSLFNEYGGGEIFEFDYTNDKGQTSKKRAVFINPKQIMVLPGAVAAAHLTKEKYYSRLRQLEGKTDKTSLEEVKKIKQILEKYFPDGQINESVWNLDETDPNKITNIKGVSKEEYRLELLKRAIRNLKAGSNINLEQIALDISEVESEIDEELTKLLTLDEAGVKGTITLEKLRELQNKIWDTINTLESSKDKLLEQKVLIQKDVAQLDEVLKYYKDAELTPQEKYDKILGISVLSEITEEAKKIYEEYGMESDPVYGALFDRINISELAAAIEQSELETAPSSEYLAEIDNAIDQYTRAIEDVQRTRAYIEKILRDHAERQGVAGAKQAPIEWLTELIDKEDSDFFKNEFELLANEENELRDLLEKKQNEVNLKTRALELATQVKNLARLQNGLVYELDLVMEFMDRFFIPPPEIVKEAEEKNPPTQNAQMDENEDYEFFKRYAPSLLEGTGFFKTIGAHQELLGRYEEMMGRSAEEKATPEFKRELERILPELRFFKFAEETKTFKEYKLRIISIKDRNEFLTKEGEPRVHFFREDETREEAHLIYLLVDAYTGKPIEDKDDKGLIYASAMDPSAWRPNGDYRFATSDFADIENPTQEELDAVAAKEEEYKQWRQEILDKKTPTYVSIEDKNNAIRKWENNDYYSRNSIVGRLIKDTNELKDAPIKVVVAPKGEERGKISLFGDKRTFVGKNGMPYITRNGQLIPLYAATLNNTPDILDIVYNALVQYGINEKAFQFDEISSNKDVNKIEGTEKNLDQILSDYIMFGAIGINRKLSKYAIYWEKGVLKFGETGTINYTELSDPTKYEDKHKELKEFLKTLSVQINKGGKTHNFLNNDINARAKAYKESKGKGKTVAPSYTKFIQTIIDEEGNVTTKTWKNYTEFLVSERNGNLPILTTNIVEDVNYVKKQVPHQRITTPQFISTYFKIDPKFGGLNIKKSPKPKIVDHMQAGRGGLELDSLHEGELYRVWGTAVSGERGYVEVPVIIAEVNGIKMFQFDLTSAVVQEDLESPQQAINRLIVINAHIEAMEGNILPSSLVTLNTALEAGKYKHNFNIVISKLGTEDPMEKVEGSTGINAIIEAADKGKSIPGFESVQKGEEEVEKEEAPAAPAVAKEGVSEIFKDNPELSKLGTEEQYSSYLETIFPDSQVKDIVYHGTDKSFEEFKIPEKYGAWFSSKPGVARNQAELLKGKNKDGLIKYSVLLDIQNPKQGTPEGFDASPSTYLEGFDSMLFSNRYENEVLIVKNPEQIHILGSKKDIKGFKSFVSKPEAPVAPVVTKALKADVILPIGTSGSGKSTWIKSINKGNDFVVISPDEMRIEFTGDINDKSKDNEIYKAVIERTIKAIEEGKRVIIDSTNLRKDRRKPFIKAVKKALPDTNIQYKLMPLNPELAKQRIKEDIAAGIERANVTDSTIDRHAKTYKEMLKDVKSEDISEFIEAPAAPENLDNIENEEEDDVFMSTDYSNIPKENYQVWDPVAETAWYNAVMPKDEKGNFLIPFEIMRDLIDGHAFGKLTKAGNILLYKEAIEGAIYHEAFHGVTRLLMTTEDRLSLYDQLRGMRGKDYTYRGTFKKLSEFTDKEVDEYLAEEFRKFRLSGGTYKIGKGRKLTWLDRFMRWLDKVLNFFTGSDDRISSLFNKINNGGFKNASIINKNRSEGVYLTPDDTAFERHVYRGMTSYLAKVAIKDRKMSFYDFYESNFKEDTEDLLAGIYGKPEDIINEMKGVATASPSVLKSLARRFSSMKAAAKSPNEKAKIEINYKNILDNWDKYITGHLEYIRHFKLEVNPDSITEENDKNKLDIIEKDEKDPNTYMSNPLRFLIGSSPMINKDGTRAFNELGLPEPVDFNDVVGYLYRALANSTSLSDMTNKLKDSIAFKPELAVIYNRLKLSESIIDPLSKESNHDWGDVRMKLAFYNQFNQANDDYLLYIQKDNGGDKYFINANTNRVEEVTRREWQSNLEGKLNDENSPFKIADNGNIVIDVETPLSYKPSKVVGEKLKFGKPKSIKDWTVSKRTFEDNLGILSSLGVEFSNSSNINPSIINTATDWILYELLDKKDVTTIFSRDQLDVGGRINELLSEELRSSSLGLDLSFQNSEGKTVFGVSRKTYLNVLVDKFNSMSLEDIELLLENSANLRGSSWIQRLKEGEKLKVVNIQGTRLDVIGRRGRHLSKGTKSDIAVVHLQAILDGYPPYLRAADQKSEYGIGFGDKTEIVPIDYARSVLTKHLEDEIRTAQLLRAEGIGSDIAGYKENAETLRYFEGIVTIPDHVLAQVMSDDQISEFVIGEQIQKEIVFHLENNIQDLKNYLYEYELVTKSNQNVGLSNTQLHNLAGALQLKYDGKNVNNDLIDAYSQQAALKHIIGTIEMSKLVLGDLAMFSKTSIFKRTKLASGAKIYPATGSEVNDWFNTNMPRSYGEHSDELVSVVRGDIMTSAEFVEEYIKVITETFGTQAGEEAREVYENLNEFDGGGFIHLDANRSLSLKLEEWSPKQEEAFQEIEKGNVLNEETMAYFPDMKPQYFGTFRTSKISVPTGYKFALFPIHENMFNPKSSLYQIAINMREQKVDMQVFESVSKVGGVLQQDGEFMPMYRDVQLGKDAVSVYNPIDNTTNKQILETGLMGLQVKNSPKLDLTTTVGTQQRTQMKNNLYEEGELDPVFADLKDDLQLMDNAYEAITEKGMNILLAKTGIVKENGVYSFKNNDAAILENFLIEEMNNRDMSRHLKNSISHLLQTDTRFTDLLMSKPKIEKLLFSLATNSTIKQKTSGSMLVQRASTGFEVGAKAIKQRDFELNNKLEGVDMKPLRFYKRGSSGKTNAMQVLAPVHWKEYIGANVDINEGIIDKELFNLIGFRIPTEGLASIDFIEVVGFLPEGYTSVVVPTELVGKAGSDYDIDKLTLYFPNYEINRKTGYLHKVKFLTGTSDTDALRRLIKIRETEPDTYLSLVSEYLPEYRKYFEHFKTQAKELRFAIKTLKNNPITKDIIKEIQDLELEISIQSEWGRNKKRVKLLNNRLREANLKFVSIVSDIEAPWSNLSEFQQITGSLEVIRRELSKYDNVLLDVFKTMPITMQNTKKALQNVILDTHWKILSHPANYSSLINPIGSPTFKSLRDSIVAKKSTSYTSRLAALTSKSNSSTLSTMEAKEMLSLSKRLNEMNENKLWSDVLSFRNVVDKSYNMWSGLGGVGAVAINSVDNPRAQQIGMKINSEYLRNNPEAALWFEGFSPYEFSLSKRKNSGGRVLISSSLSELGQGYVDVTADDWVFMINAGLNFSMVWTLYLRAGVPIDLLGYFMNQPIVDEFVRQKNIKQGTHRDTFEGASIGYQSDSYIMKGIKKNIKGAAKLPLVQLSKAELYNMIGNTLEGMNSREKAIQLQVLSMLEAAMNLGREAGGFHKVTAYDTNAPSDRASIRYMRVAKEVLQSKNIFVDNKEEDAVEATLSLPVLSGFKNVTAEFPEIFKNLFVADTIVEYNAKADEIVRQGIENNLFEDDIIYTLNRFENHIIIHTLQNSKLGTDKQLKQRANSLMQGLSSLPNRIANMKRGSTNLLIKELHPILQPYTNPKHPEYGVSNLQLRRKKLAPADLELLGDSYLELYNNPEFKDLALDILFFSLLQSGNNFSRISIFHSIPDWVLIDLAKDAIGQIANSRVNFREIVPSFYANSHKDGLISPYFNSRDLSSFKGLVESEDGKLMLSSNRGGFNSGRLAIPAWHRASRNNSITISIPAISQAKIKEYQKIDKRIPMITKLFGKKDSINVGEQKLFVYEEINKQGNGIYHVEIGDTTIHNKNKVIDAQKIGNSVIPMGLRSVKRSIASGNITKLVLFNELKTQAGNEGVIETADGAILKVRKLGTYTKGQLSKDKVKSSLGITSLDDLLKQAGLISYPYFGKVFKNTTFVKTKNKGPVHIYEVEILNSGYYTDEEIVYNQGKEFDSSGFKKIEKDEQSSAEIAAAQLNAAEKKLEDACKGKKS